MQLHYRAHDIRALGSSALKKTHIVHRVKDLSVCGLKAVDLGDSTGNYNAHRIGHIVFLDGFRNRLGNYRGINDFLRFVLFLFLRHFIYLYLSKSLIFNVKYRVSRRAYHTVVKCKSKT